MCPLPREWHEQQVCWREKRSIMLKHKFKFIISFIRLSYHKRWSSYIFIHCIVLQVRKTNNIEAPHKCLHIFAFVTSWLSCSWKKQHTWKKTWDNWDHLLYCDDNHPSFEHMLKDCSTSSLQVDFPGVIWKTWYCWEHSFFFLLSLDFEETELFFGTWDDEELSFMVNLFLFCVFSLPSGDEGRQIKQETEIFFFVTFRGWWTFRLL